MDYRIEIGWRSHPKRRRLRRLLGADAVLALEDLWEFCATPAHDRTEGDLSGMSDSDIADAAGWEGDAAAFVAALVGEEGGRRQFLDGEPGAYRLHDWAEHQPFVHGYKRRVALAKSAAAKRWADPEGLPAHALRMLTIEDERARRMRTALPPACQPHAEGNAPTPSPSPSPSPIPIPEEKKKKDASRPEDGPSLVALESRYPTDLAAETRAACALSRRSGKLADSVWLSTLRAMAPHPAEAVERAMRTFVDRHADGEKDERYLLGIVRGELRHRVAPTVPSSAPPVHVPAPPLSPEEKAANVLRAKALVESLAKNMEAPK